MDYWVKREQIGLRAPKWRTPFSIDVKAIVIHWLGVDGTVENAASTWRGVQNFHMDKRGWSDIAYNFGVSNNGVVYEGRGLDHQSGANGKGQNRDKIAICAIMTTEETPTEDFWAALQSVISHVVDRWPNVRQIIGHRDIGQTACPGDKIMSNLGQLSLAQKVEMIGDTSNEAAAVADEVAAALKAKTDAQFKKVAASLEQVIAGFDHLRVLHERNQRDE